LQLIEKLLNQPMLFKSLERYVASFIRLLEGRIENRFFDTRVYVELGLELCE